MSKRSKGFHQPFDKLKALKGQLSPTPAALGRGSPPKVERPPAGGTIADRPATVPPSVASDAPPADERLFIDEMSGVAPLEPDPRGRLGAPAATPAPPVARGARRGQDAEVHAALADLCKGVGPFEIADSDEYVEGLGPGVDRRLLVKLRRGDFALQGHVDLHGLTAAEAKGRVEAFLEAARRDGQRCVLIVHGRGLNSKDGVPVLKERLKTWLSRGRLARAILAFATARPTDGGAGALYVLLRR